MQQFDELEQRLVALAAYHTGRVADAAARIENSPALMRHALWVLIEEARARREQLLQARG